MLSKSHLTVITRTPCKAQTAQQLKFETIMVYLNNFLSLQGGLYSILGELSNEGITPLIGTLPYKQYFGGGGTDTGGGGTEET